MPLRNRFVRLDWEKCIQKARFFCRLRDSNGITRRSRRFNRRSRRFCLLDSGHRILHRRFRQRILRGSGHRHGIRSRILRKRRQNGKKKDYRKKESPHIHEFTFLSYPCGILRHKPVRNFNKLTLFLLYIQFNPQRRYFVFRHQTKASTPKSKVLQLSRQTDSICYEV